jgi:rubrerythrin
MVMEKMELEEIFAIAIKREIKSHEFYHDVAGKVKNTDARKVFEQLAEEEMEHMETLEKLKDEPAAYVKFNPPAKDFKIAEATEIEAPTLDMKPREAIALAMKKELESVEFYRGLSAAATDSNIKAIFDNLVNMELNHKARLENVFVEIGYPEVF